MMLKDVMILYLAHIANSEMDAQLLQAINARQPIEPGLLQHVLDEARNIPNLPETHGAFLQKLFTQISQQS